MQQQLEELWSPLANHQPSLTRTPMHAKPLPCRPRPTIIWLSGEAIGVLPVKKSEEVP